MAATLLGGLGANVIKVEEPGKGDPNRGLIGAYFAQGGRSRYFESLNLNKRGITLDLKQEEGRDVFYRLVEGADVFMTNFRSAAAHRLGLDYITLSSMNPKLVYALASGWGKEGTESERGAYDIAAAARGGLMYMSGEPKTPPEPQRVPGGICDVAGAMCFALGIMGALQARERIGRGQMVDTSLFGSAIALATQNISFALAFGFDQEYRPRSNVRNPLYSFYKCADGEWIYLIMMQFDRYWSTFCWVMGIEELEKDPRFSTLQAMMDNSDQLIPTLDEIFATKTRAEWLKIFAEYDFHCAPIQRTSEVVNDPQAIANDYITEFDHPAYGREKVIGLPYKFTETPASVSRPCPELGQHTEEILLELGYSWDDITRLKQGAVI